MQCGSCGKIISGSDDYEDLGNGSYKCSWCGRNAKCIECGNTISETETYQYCGDGTDVFVCEDCSNY